MENHKCFVNKTKKLQLILKFEYCLSKPEGYSEPCLSRFQSLTIFAKKSVSDVRQSCEGNSKNQFF